VVKIKLTPFEPEQQSWTGGKPDEVRVVNQTTYKNLEKSQTTNRKVDPENYQQKHQD